MGETIHHSNISIARLRTHSAVEPQEKRLKPTTRATELEKTALENMPESTPLSAKEPKPLIIKTALPASDEENENPYPLINKQDASYKLRDIQNIYDDHLGVKPLLKKENSQVEKNEETTNTESEKDSNLKSQIAPRDKDKEQSREPVRLSPKLNLKSEVYKPASKYDHLEDIQAQMVREYKKAEYTNVLEIFTSLLKKNIEISPNIYYIALKAAYANQDVKLAMVIYNFYQANQTSDSSVLHSYQFRGLIHFLILMKRTDLAMEIIEREKLFMDTDDLEHCYALLINAFISNSDWKNLTKTAPRLMRKLKTVSTESAIKIDLSELTLEAAKLVILHYLLHEPRATYHFIYKDERQFAYLGYFIKNLGFRFICSEQNAAYTIHPVTQKVCLPSKETHHLDSIDGIKAIAGFLERVCPS